MPVRYEPELSGFGPILTRRGKIGSGGVFSGMTSHYRISRALSLCFALALPACVMSPDDDGADTTDNESDAPSEPETGQATSALSLGGWNAAHETYRDTWHGAQVASLNGVTYVVSVGNCGSFDCYPFAHDTTQLRWWKIVNGVEMDGGDIGNQSANSKVSLAAFNGYLYMLHTGSDNSSATYLSRFNPTTETWTQRSIGFTSFGGPPAIVAYNNKLYLIGTSNYPYQMWYATMDVNENFTPQRAIPGHDAASRPSATVAFNKLWFAHRWGQTGDIVYGTFDGTTWSGAQHIYGGVNNGPIQGLEPVIAFDGAILRLVHRRPNDRYLWQQSYDGCRWAATETTLGTQQSSLEPSLAPGGPGLVLLTERDHNDLFGLTAYFQDWRTFTRNPFNRPPICSIVLGSRQVTNQILQR